MEYKKCNFCHKLKPLEEFTYLKSQKKYMTKCKECKREYEKKYRSARREKFRQINKIQYEKSKERRIESAKKYRREHIDAVNEVRRKNYHKRMKTDPLFKCRARVRQVIIHSFKRKKLKKNISTSKIVGCDNEFLYKYLLNTYKKRYNKKYDGKEKVHIDHIIPLATATTEEEIVSLCHYSNLQLLKAEDNLKKGSNIV